MKLENEFVVPAPVEEAWVTLLDVPLMIDCMPGAELVGEVDDSTWQTNMKISFGPIGMTFGTEVRQERVDEAAREVHLKAKARELRNRGAAQARVVSTLTPEGGVTRVAIATDLQLQGPAAQFGRGLVQDVSSELVGQFAENLRATLAPNGDGPPAADGATTDAPKGDEPPPVRPAAGAQAVSGFALGAKALRMAVVRLFRRLVRRPG